MFLLATNHQQQCDRDADKDSRENNGAPKQELLNAATTPVRETLATKGTPDAGAALLKHHGGNQEDRNDNFGQL